MNKYTAGCVSILTWPVMITINLIAIVLGWVLIPIAVLCRAYIAYAPGQYGHYKYKFTWAWLNRVYGNWEDGIAAGWQYKDTGSVPLQIIYWSCNRNPVNNLRTVPYLSCKVSAKDIGYIGSFGQQPLLYDAIVTQLQWFFVWQGPYTGFYYVAKWPVFGLRRLWLGFKLYPDNSIKGASPYQKAGVGFAMQFRPLK